MFILPPGSKCAWTVLQQSLKNASVPAFKFFKESLLSSLQDLSGSLPDSRRRKTESIAQRIAGLCETNYKMYAASFPKHVFAPYLSKQARRLPPGNVMSVFDKGPMVANLACPVAWHHTMHAILRDSPRFNKLITFAHPTDAKCPLLWQLSDSLALTLTGAYCSLSISMNRTPLAPSDAAKAFKAYRSYPPSPAPRCLAQPVFDSACKKLKTAGPSVDMPKGPGAPARHPLIGPRELGSMASAMDIFPPEPSEPQQPTAHIRPETGGRGHVRPAQAPSRRQPSTRRITLSRRWRTIFTDHDLLRRDLHTALLPDAPDLPAMPQGNPKHLIPPKQGKLLAHMTSLSSTPPQPDHVYPSAARPPKSQKYTTRFGVPDAMVMSKHKYRETEPGAKVKAREVISPAPTIANRLPGK